ncbi:MAG: flagellar hook assembly protein FlgD [Hyphomicrobiales bacterium]|nr:flagellar hook assembly protein FlgD [Hyphomicrobiales bacterium]
MILGSTSATSASLGQQAATSQSKLDEDLNKFLTLLVTQLQNQDPLEPLDTHEFTAQLVDFANVEQQIQQNSHLETLITAQTTGQAAASVAYLGTQVEAQSDQIPLQDGEASASYTLSEPAAKTQILVTDAQGNVLFSESGATTTGQHTFHWNGTDTNGNVVADGAYQLQIAAENQDGELIDVPTTVKGTVDSVSFADGAFTLHLGELEVALDKIQTVHAAKATAAQNTADTQ